MNIGKEACEAALFPSTVWKQVPWCPGRRQYQSTSKCGILGASFHSLCTLNLQYISTFNSQPATVETDLTLGQGWLLLRPEPALLHQRLLLGSDPGWRRLSTPAFSSTGNRCLVQFGRGAEPGFSCSAWLSLLLIPFHCLTCPVRITRITVAVMKTCD